MFGRLVQKELLHHLLDLRFLLVFVLCVFLVSVGTVSGVRNHLEQLQQHRAVSKRSQAALQTSLERGRLHDLYKSGGYRWNRRPEVLSPVVYGKSGSLGQEVKIQYRQWFPFEASRFATDPIHALFGVLDVAFVVKIVLSLCMLLFTYDAVCGEKEAGTLRLYTSFPLRRSTIALAKIAGSTVAVLAPFLLAFLMMSALMALSPELGMSGDGWLRVAALFVVFGLYLSAFAGFGIWVSALTHRRITAFLALLALWMVWVFVLPNVGVGLARRLIPVESVYEIEKELDAIREEIKSSRRTEMRAFRFRPPPELAQAWQDLMKRGKDVPAAERKATEKWMNRAWREAYNTVRSKVDKAGDGVYFARVRRIQEEWRNRGRRQRQLAKALSALSPMSAATFASMDLARTGIAQHERIEDALGVHHAYLARFIQEKWPIDGSLTSAGDLTDFVPFEYHDVETVSESVSRNLVHILNLALLSILGFAGAYVAILKYDVR